jgi:hypothetical protein
LWDCCYEENPSQNIVIEWLSKIERDDRELAAKLSKGIGSSILALPKKGETKVIRESLMKLYPTLVGLAAKPKAQTSQPAAAVDYRCKQTHEDPADVGNFEEVLFAGYFGKGSKLEGVVCRKCKQIVTHDGPLKPTADCPVRVCKSLMQEKSKSCLCEGAWCHQCYMETLKSTTGRLRRRTVAGG